MSHRLDVQQWFGHKGILSLRDKTNKPSVFGRSTTGRRTLIGLKGSHPVGLGAEERRLFFDAKTMVHARCEMRANPSEPLREIHRRFHCCGKRPSP
jgi:hypothetical protein